MEPSTQNLSLSVGGVHCGAEAYGVIVLGREDPGWPGLKRTYLDLPFGHGSEGDGGYLNSAKWTIPCMIREGEETTARQRLENFLYLLNSEQELELVFDSRPDVYFLVSATGEAPAVWHAGAGGLQFDLALDLADPTAYAVSSTATDFTIESAPDSFTVLAAGLALGAVPPLPDWIVECGAASSGITISNAATGESFTTPVDSAMGTFVKLDSRLQEVSTSPDGVTWTRNNLGASGTIPRLKPRSDNAIKFSGPTAGTLTCQYRERFAGLVR